MSRPPPNFSGAGVYRLLLADEIATALIGGRSVVATGICETGDVLDLAAAALAEAGVRVLVFRPPLDSAAFIGQFATEWRVTVRDTDAAGGFIVLPKGSVERFVVLIHEAHTMPTETFRHLERLAQAWPGMQIAFAGLPILAEVVQSDEHPTLKRRVGAYIRVAGAPEPLGIRDSDGQPSLAAAVDRPAEPVLAAGDDARVSPRPEPRRARQSAGRWAAVLGVAGLLAAVTVAMTGGLTGVSRLHRIVGETAGAGVTAGGLPVTAPPVLQTAAADAARSDDLVPERDVAKAAEPAIVADLAPPPAEARSEQPATQEPLVASPSPSEATITAATAAMPDPVPVAASEPDPLVAARWAEAAQTVAAAFRDAALGHGPTISDPASGAGGADMPVPLSPPPNRPAPASMVSLAMADAMTRRGRAMLDFGDVSAARLLLARAAGAGSGPAALAMGTTFDTATLERIGAVGISPDPVQAASWYRLALTLGETRASIMLDALSTRVIVAGPEAARE